MNFSSPVSYGNHSGIQTSQLISRNAKVVDSIALGKVSENVNRFLSGHSRKNVNHPTRKFQLNEYFKKDLKAKTSSTYHFLCGPLNTKRLTRKTITCNFDEPSTSALPLGINDLYNSKQINKPPWIEEPVLESHTLPVNQQKSLEARVDPSFKFNPAFDDNFSHNVISSGEQILQDGEVPDPIHVDLQDSCPLYDSSEYEQCSGPINVSKDSSDNEKSEPDISRYNFFIGGFSDEKFSISDRVSDSLICIKNDDKRCSENVDNVAKRRKRLAREEVFLPLITWPDDDDDGDGFSVMNL